MKGLFIKCPTTSSAVFTGLAVHATPANSVLINCPDCGGEHPWALGDAFVREVRADALTHRKYVELWRATMEIKDRRILITKVASKLSEDPDPPFILKAYDIPPADPEGYSTGESSIRHLLLDVPDDKLLLLALDILDGGPDEKFVKALAGDGTGILASETQRAQTANRAIGSIDVSIAHLNAVTQNIQGEIDRGDSTDPNRLEFDLLLLQGIVIPSLQAARRELDALIAATTLRDVLAAEAAVKAQGNLIRTIYARAFSPQVQAAILAALEIFKLLKEAV